jgi:anaerobic glycerol-3-phosphate dehydrogenase
LSLTSSQNGGTVGTGGLVVSVVSGPVDATIRRKSATGEYRPGSITRTLAEGEFVSVGSVSTADYATYPILEFDVDSADPADDWECSLAP